MADAVSDASSWAKWMVQRELRGPGDLDNAMRRVAERHGIPFATLWGLRYRPPKDVFVGVYLKLQAAYVSECLRQERLLRHERENTKAKGVLGEALIRAADAVAGEEI